MTHRRDAENSRSPELGWFEWDDGPDGLGAEYQLQVEVRARPTLSLPLPAVRLVDPQQIAPIARARAFQWRPLPPQV